MRQFAFMTLSNDQHTMIQKLKGGQVIRLKWTLKWNVQMAKATTHRMCTIENVSCGEQIQNLSWHSSRQLKIIVAFVSPFKNAQLIVLQVRRTRCFHRVSEAIDPSYERFLSNGGFV